MKAQKERTHQLNELDELREKKLFHTKIVHQQKKEWHDILIRSKVFQEGYLALFYDSSYNVTSQNALYDFGGWETNKKIFSIVIHHSLTMIHVITMLWP